MTLVENLRVSQYTHKDVLLAADMLEFVFGQMQMHSPKMDGISSYRFRNGWPMTCAKGRWPEEAIIAAMAEVRLNVKLSSDESDGKVT